MWCGIGFADGCGAMRCSIECRGGELLDICPLGARVRARSLHDAVGVLLRSAAEGER